HFEHRLSIDAASMDDLRRQLAALIAVAESGAIGKHVVTDTQPPIAFLFTGQGAQYVDMLRQLYATQPTFRQAFDRCDELLRPYLSRSLLGLVYPDLEPSAGPSSAPSAPSDLIHQTTYTQAALFALEYALAELWRAWGIEPDYVMGHSIGELVAACVAG